jgi:pyrroloquinoline quinone (PQQ) biosynthesis protein C
MGIEAPEVITTKTLFRPTAAATGPALSPDEYEHEFLQAIAEAVRSFRTPEEPLPDVVLTDQAKARRYFAIDGMTHSFFAKVFPSCLMNVASKCPYSDVRREIIEDCYCEEITDPDARDMCHVEVLYYDAELLGLAREEVEAFEVSPILMTCVHTLDNLTRTLPWEGGYAATGGLEALQVAIARGYLAREEYFGSYRQEDIERICGLPEGSLMNQRLHAMKDQLHGGGALSILRKYVTTRECQEMTFWAVKLSRQIRVITQREQRRLARAAIGLPADALIVT